MLLFIHDNFKLDLTHLKVTFNDENPWFNDELKREISFPFKIDVEGEFAKNSEFSIHYNPAVQKTVYSGLLDRDGQILNVLLKIQSLNGKVAEALITTDANIFSNFTKKLTELPLEQKDVIDIVADAEAVIELGYPDTNYTFPMVHTDKYDPSQEDWNGFEKIINNYRDGAFLENALDEEHNIDLIKNIVQPMPYLLHVLEASAADAGFQLSGDILTDPNFSKAVIFRDGSYYKRLSEEAIPFHFLNSEWTDPAGAWSGIPHVAFQKGVEITKKGDYNIFGDVYALYYKGSAAVSFAAVTRIYLTLTKVSGGVPTVLYDDSWGEAEEFVVPFRKRMKKYSFDLNVSFEVGDFLILNKTEAKRDSVPSETPDYPEAVSLDIFPVRYRNPDNSPIISVLNLNEIDLKRVVPDITVGETINAIKNWGNFDLITEDNLAIMNKIQPQVNRDNAVDLSDWDIPEPERTFHEDRSFEFAFKDGKSSEVYKYDSVFITADGHVVNDYKTKDTTNVISVDALPLPVITRLGVTTAHAFEDESSKLRLLFCRPMEEDGRPVAFDNPEVLLPVRYLADYKEWLHYRINSTGWTWDFLIPVEKFREINIQTMIYAYSNYHLFSEVERERIDAMWWRITAKSESLV